MTASMPFDFDDYQKRCNGMSTEQLNKEWDNYTRQIAGGATSTATSVLLAAFTGGVSLVGLGFSAPRIHNARKKREIIQASLEAQNATHHTHAKDVLIPMATVGAAGGITLGLGVSGAEFIPTSGGMGHSAVDYLATHAAASGTVTYFKYKARELAKKTEEETPEAGLHISHTWPQGPADLEKVGPQLPPIVHGYSTFGHPEVEYVEEYFVPLSVQPQIPLPVAPPVQTTPISPSSFSETASDYGVSAHPNVESQNVRSLSLPLASSKQSIPRKQVARTQSAEPRALQSLHVVDEKPSVIDPIIREESNTASPVTISDAELDALVAVLTDEEQMLLLMRLELELRSPGGCQPLHRTKAVHASHGRKPHIKHHDERTASQSLETESRSSSPTTSHRFSVQLSDGPSNVDEAALILPPRHPSLPLRPSQAPQQSPLPPRAPSLPGRLDRPNIPTTSCSNPGIRSSQILRKPLSTSPQQSYIAEPASLQSQPLRPKDQRQDSGYYSATSTPAIPASTDVPPCYTPQSFSAQGQRGSQSSISSPASPPPPPYYPPPPTAAGLNGGKDYFNQAAVPNAPLSHDKDLHSSAVQKEGLNNILGIFGWQWSAGLERASAGDTKTRGFAEPDYGPPPAIPAVWKG